MQLCPRKGTYVLLQPTKTRPPTKIFDSSPRQAQPFLSTKQQQTQKHNGNSRAVRDANGNKRALTPHQQQTAVYGGLDAIVFSFLLLSEDTDAVALFTAIRASNIIIIAIWTDIPSSSPADAGVLGFKNPALSLDRGDEMDEHVRITLGPSSHEHRPRRDTTVECSATLDPVIQNARGDSASRMAIFH